MTTINNNQITLPVRGGEDMQKVVTDLLITNKQAYNFIILLMDGGAQQATTKDLSNFARLIENFNGLDNYYASELLYMLEFAFNEIEED